MADAETTLGAVEPSTGIQMPQKHSGTTTIISTISLQSGETRLVIALLQSAEYLQLKVLEESPEITQLGDTLKQALGFQRQHEEVILKLQGKQSPVEELLRHADQLISAQRPRAEVYAAMAESLGVAWKDVNNYLDLRKHILELNVSYQSRAEECIERMLTLETACQDTNVPVEIEAVKSLLTRLHDLKRMMLEALMVALQNGRALHEKISEVAAQGTLDTRADKFTSAAKFTISQIEHWLEDLHDKRKLLEVKWQNYKTQLEQCLSLSLLAKDLKELDEILFIRKETLRNSNVQMGDSTSSAELILFEHRKLINEARELQDRCLKITKATEKLKFGGHFAVEQASIQAYAVLNASVEYLEALEERDALLNQSVAFFRLSRTEVKCTAQELENRNITLENLCTVHKEENIHMPKAFTAFLERQNELYYWLVNIAEAFLQGHQDLGSVLAMAGDFLQLHQQLLKDLQNKGIEINDVLLTLPPILEKLSDDQRTNIDKKVDTLHSHWLNLKNILESRIDLASLYVKFHSLAVELTNEFDTVEVQFRKGPDCEEDLMTRIEQKWMYIQQMTEQLTNLGKVFIEESLKIGDPYLDVKRTSLCVETLLEHFANRQLVITQSWRTWQTAITTERECNVLWERNVRECERIMQWISKIHCQLYPVLTGESTAAKIITKELEEKLRTILPELKRAQIEIELRVKTAETLAMKGEHHGQNEAIISKLMVLHNELNDTATDYQILLQMLISFFKKLSEVENIIENLKSQFNITRLPNVCSELELFVKEHEASEQTVLELFKFTQKESEYINNMIVQQEQVKAADYDTRRIISLLEDKQESWKTAWTARKLLLEEQQHLCQFDSDLQQINSNLNDLSRQLNTLKGQYGESLTSAKATSAAFDYFEKTIQGLENKVERFMSTTNQILKSEPVSSHVKSKLNELKKNWSSFMNQVKKSRDLINMNIEYFTLVKEGEEWFRMGSQLLITIARKSTAVKRPHEADQLLTEVEIFLKNGDLLQQERVKKISSLAEELHGEEGSKHVVLVRNGNNEMADSFTIVRKELHILAQNLRAAEKLRERQKKVEAEAVIISPRDSEDVERLRKSPSPPSKRAKIFEVQRSCSPIFTVPLQGATVQEGQQFTFECRVTGFPVPEVIWYKDGISIQNNPDYRTSYDNGISTLAIEETFSEDSACFTCKATNAEGSAETCATLSVQETEPEERFPPVFRKRIEERFAKEGSSLYLMCTVEGNPLPTVQWFKNNICIDNSSDYVITYNNGEAVIKFEKLFLEDQAEYTCKASNSSGTDKCSAKLIVEPLESTEAPLFISSLSNIMARAGRKTQLECEVKGLPLPELIWTHNAKLIEDCQDIKLQYENGKGILTINEAFPKDAGTYSVVAKNIAGEANCSCNVSVKGRLPTETSDSEIASDFEPIKPSIQLSLKDVSVLEGEQVCLECIIIGQPEPEVIWYRNNNPVKESSDFQLLFQGDKCTLVIHEAYLEDAGEYKVVAINSGGEASSKCNLTVKSLGDAEPMENLQEVKVTEMPQGTRPKFSKLLTDIFASEGDNVLSGCSALGDPKPDIKWYLDNQELTDIILKEVQCSINNEPISREDALISADGDQELSIQNVRQIHSGNVACVAENDAGRTKCTSRLYVHDVPIPRVLPTEENIETCQKEIPVKQSVVSSEVFDGQSSTSIIRGVETHITSCSEQTLERIKRKSPVQVQSQKLKDIQRITNESSDAGQQSFLTSSNRKESQDSSISSYTAPTTSSRCIQKSVAPRFISPLNGIIVNEGAQVILEGIVDGYPSPIVSWTKNSQVLIPLEGKLSLNYDHKRVEVILKDATVQDTGRYTCTAVNNVGSASSTADVLVKKTLLPPIFGRRLQAQSVKEGERVVLEVEIISIPDPLVMWYKDGQHILCTVPDSPFRTKVQGNCYSLVMEKALLGNSGQYLVKAVNSKGEAASMADIVVYKPDPQTETMKKILLEDPGVSEIEEIISTFTSEVQTEKTDITPLLVKPAPLGPAVKQNMCHSLPSPSKFVKGEFRESDYESDFESRIPPKWKPADADAEEPKYKPVHPVLSRKDYSQSPLFDARTLILSKEIDNLPEFRSPPKPKFEPIENPFQSCAMDSIHKSSMQRQKVFKPKPVTPKTAPSTIAIPGVKSKEFIVLKSWPSPGMGYTPPSFPHIAPFEKITQIKTSKVRNCSESTERKHHVVNVQNISHMVRHEKEKEESYHEPQTFSVKTDPGKYRIKGPLLCVPKKFVPGDFYESEYESDLEAVKIKPKWTPGNSDTEDPQYRKVVPPQTTHPTRGPPKTSSKSTEYNLISTTNIAQAISTQKSDVQKVNVSSVGKIRNNKTYKSEENWKSQSMGTEINRQQDIILQPEESPEFCSAGNVTSVASYVSSKCLSDMTKTFRSKAQHFACDIVTEVSNSTQNAEPEKIISTRIDSNSTGSGKVIDDPQAYREESIISEHGTKHIDPNTGLIYFKYDFGYEFGIVLPNEGKKQEGRRPKYPQIDRKQTGDIEVPVIHENNTKGNKNITGKAIETEITPGSTTVSQFTPNKFSHFNLVKWEPASESKISEIEGDSAKLKKNSTLSQFNLAIQKETNIHNPPTPQWIPTPSSPLSLSLFPSLPRLSPNTGATLDTTASPGDSWQDLSPIKSPQIGYVRDNTSTPPSMPSTPRSTSGLIPEYLCKPPSFITTLRDIAVMKGQPVCIECIVQAEPPPNILWAKDGRLLENSVKQQIHFRNGVCRLILFQTSTEDSGIYTCTATNKLGTVKTSGLLQVSGEKCFLHK